MSHPGFLLLMGNMVGIAIFGTVICSISRLGLGGLKFLFSGIIGNMANSALRFRISISFSGVGYTESGRLDIYRIVKGS
jgi:hypothetical protein